MKTGKKELKKKDLKEVSIDVSSNCLLKGIFCTSINAEILEEIHIDCLETTCDKHKEFKPE